jgi:hypothetical protein
MRRLVLISALAVMVVLAAIVAAAPALGQGSNGQEPAYKQAFEAAEQARQAAAEQGPHAPKQPEMKPAASCASTNPIQTGIFPFRFGPFFGGRYIVNYASVVSNQGVHYVVYAGAPDDTPRQGLVRVLSEPLDPCAASAGQTGSSVHDYLTVSGPLTLTRINGDTVEFAIAGGGVKRFNFVTDQFLP